MTDQLSERDDPTRADDPTPAMGVPAVQPMHRSVHDPTLDPTLDARPPRTRWFRRRRVSKWDRPPDPHDWRFFVGGLGKILIATGLLLFGFVAYQLWGTGIETARAQHALENDFEAALAEIEFEAADQDTTADQEADQEVVEPGSPEGDDAAPDAAPDAENDASSEDVAGVDEPAPPPPADPVELDEAAVQQNIPAIERGAAIGRLEMPTIDKSVFVVPGVEVDDLKDGPGHYPDTPLPGQLGNSSIAGHRTTYGEPFIDLDDLEVGDDIIVTTLYGRFVYEVTGSQVVGPDDSWVVQTTDWDVATLTLTTCHPKYTARDRLVVSAIIDPERSSSVGEPTFYELDAGSGGEIGGDDPTVDVTTPSEDAPVLDADGTADVEPADPVAAADEPVDDEPVDVAAGGEDTGAAAERNAEPGGDVAIEPEVAAPPVAGGELAGTEAAGDGAPTPEDAFSRGWFDDDEAFPQIALWGAALMAISLAAYAVSRRVRHDSVGFVLGIAPFVVALYFFFQNVHRLLPPGI